MASRTRRKARTTRATRITKSSLERYKRQIPGRLAQIRGARSQRSFARDLGVFQQNVNRYESGKTPHADFLITLALKEGVSIDWLLLGRGRARAPSKFNY